VNPVVVIGDTLLDRDIEGDVERVCPDAPAPVVDARATRTRPGGAGLAAALLAAEGREVTLVTAICDDEPGHEVRHLLAQLGIELRQVELAGRTPEKVRIRSAGRTLLRVDHSAGVGTLGPLSEAAERCIAGAAAVLVADYGWGMAAHPAVRRALAASSARGAIVWDPHPRGPAPIRGVRLATPNASEAARLLPELSGGPIGSAAARASALRARWQATGVAVTLGEHGAVLAALDGPPLVIPAPAVRDGDPCGAGDRFAGAAAGALADGALLSDAVAAAVVAASAFVASGGAGAVAMSSRAGRPARQRAARSADALVAEVRASGGTVVATGGCFDLLHAGHVALLQAARRLGDCLVVCLNSDDSVRRLKGPDRPMQAQADRATVLLALDCVDAVAVFDEETPVRVLERLRPDVFCKGADYAATDLPEAAALTAWGGAAVVLPYVPGRSTTRLVEEVRHGP
jgi:D-beta-D-heptose 7-phosphate kinase/D-beta-D-heptose 1-phosphate adenosyltransferase